MGIGTYIDSTSVHEWDKTTDIGPFAMSVSVYDPYAGPSLLETLGTIRGLPGVERAAYLERSWGSLSIVNETYYTGYYGEMVGLDSDFLTVFPNSYVLTKGRLPTNVSEIALFVDASQALHLSVGDKVNCTLPDSWSTLSVVGVFSVPKELYSSWSYYSEVAILDRGLLQQGSIVPIVLLDVNRTLLSPFDANGAWNYLSGIEKSIRTLDPSYNPPSSYFSRFVVNDPLANAIASFMGWRTGMRFTELIRGGAVVLLVVLTMFLAIRFNMNDRRYERSVLTSRGASKSDLNRMVIRELAGLAFTGLIIGLLSGVLISRVASTATGFFEFDQARLWSEPFLVTIESIATSVVLGLVLPAASFVVYTALYSTKLTGEVQRGRLAKMVRVFVLLRWDFAILVLTGLVMFLTYTAGSAVKTNPVLTIMGLLSPVILFIGLSSLTVKGFRRGANWLSRRISRITGDLPAYGVRRIGKEASSAGVIAVIIVLSLTIAWGYAFVGTSIPMTKINQARLAFGADVTFHIDKLSAEERGDFVSNASLNSGVEAGASLSVLSMMLSASSYDYATAVAMNPSEYLKVGYDYEGTPLESSELRQAIVSLESTPNGIIISSDIATEYELNVGDTLRTSYESTNGSKVIIFIILAVTPALSDALLLDTGYEQPYSGPIYYGANPPPYDSSPYYYWPFYQVGKNTMWTNGQYLSEQLNLTEVGVHLYCVRTTPDANATAVAQEIIGSAWNDTIGDDDWASVTRDLTGYMNQAEYRIDRSIDTMFTVCMILSMFAALIVYAGEDVQARRREVALLRAMGSDSRLVAKVQGAEMLVLAFSGILLTLIFAPILIFNWLMLYSTSFYVFPVIVTLIVPWLQLTIILLLFVTSITAFIVLVAIFSPRINLAVSLNAAWAEASPYGGEL